VAPSLGEHPFDRLYRAGVPLSVNSDDPPFFDTTLTDEYRRLHRAFGYRPAELAGLALAALRHAFLDRAEAEAWELEFRQEFAELGEELLGAPVEPVLPPGEG
jgi:adenosine deaminase